MGILKKNWAFKLFVVAILGITTCVSYAAQPSTQSNKVGQRVNSSQVTLSFTLYHELMYKSPAEIVRYLKQRGCALKKATSTEYMVDVKGGRIVIFMNKPIYGVAPICFVTADNNVSEAWIRSLTKQGYNTDNCGLWYGDTGHWPSFRIITPTPKTTGICLDSYPLKYNPKTGGWE